MLNYSPSSDRNKEVITQQLTQVFAQSRKVLEVGSGSGQHVLHFAEQLPHIDWQPSDLDFYFTGLQENLTERPANVQAPLQLDLSQTPWHPGVDYDGIFSANSLHIMSWQEVIDFFERSAKQLASNGILCVYGPFRYNNEFTSPSNGDFDIWLKNRDVLSGIRDFEAVNQLAHSNGLTLLEDLAMPANNQLLSWIKS
jgi:cyclopropane fatty-acyl-phospholipid synthase-like methyltransferase